MAGTFAGSSYNQPLQSWNVANVIDMSGIFWSGLYNQPINAWNIGSVTDLSFAFAGNFNQPLSDFDTSSVVDMSHTFDSNFGGFNENITSWDVSIVSSFRFMFSFASSFNQDLSSWDVSGSSDFTSMFQSSGLTQDLCPWGSKISNASSAVDGMFADAGFCSSGSDPDLNAPTPGPFCENCVVCCP